MTDPARHDPNEPTTAQPAASADATPSKMHAAPTSAQARAAGDPAALTEQPGRRIGPYKILQVIGEGGFGSVYMAEQQKPVARRVALKIIKLGMDTRQVVARFEQERQALAMMDHPNIARVFDAGATETGRPYFAMELVRGDPITDYCDRNTLGTEERLELFVQVCQAVQHAHQKGIIHRDIKPSNVLVTVADGRPIPKVIDFGIAKATSAKLTDKTLVTEYRALIGTPEYMSPEQAEMYGVDIDTRSDIYSLGVLLYALLTGTTPFASSELRSATLADLQRIVREVDPPRPSTRLSTMGDRLKSIAAHRRTEPSRLRRTIRGDLDWIVLKALEKDRTRRYETANGLAADIRRHLAGEPVVAAPPSTFYRMSKFVRRNKVPVAAGVVVVSALVLGLAGTLWQAQVARTEARRADAAATAERERADQLKQVSDFQAGMLEQVDPTTAGAHLAADIRRRFSEALAKSGVPDDAVRQRAAAFSADLARVNATDAALGLIDEAIMQPAVKAIDEQFKEQPLTDARLRQVLSDRYIDLGLPDAAAPLEAGALATRRRLLGTEHPDTLESLRGMGALLYAQGRYAEAESSYSEALEQGRRALGEDHPDVLRALSGMGSVLYAQGKYAEAEPYYSEALERGRRILGEDHPDVLRSISGMGSVLHAQGKYAEAEPYFREALEQRRRVRGEDHPDTLRSMSTMGSLLLVEGDLAGAEPYYREALERRRRVLGEDHPDTLISINNLASLRRFQGRLDEAEPYFREALEKRRRVSGEEHPMTLLAMRNMGSLLRDQGKFAEAEPYVREALEASRRVLGPEHPQTLIAISNMGDLRLAQGRPDEAQPYVREALEARRRVLGPEHPQTLISINMMGELLEAQGKPDEAEADYRDALDKRRRVLGDEHRATLESVMDLGDLLAAEGRPAEVVDLLAGAESSARRVFVGGNARRLGTFLVALGRARAQGPYDAATFAIAEANLLEAHAILVKAAGEQQDDTRQCVQGLIDLDEAWELAEPGEGHGAKAAEWKDKLDDSDQAAPAAPQPR